MWESLQILPSIAVTQPNQETTWGSSPLNTEYNDFFSIKASGYCLTEWEPFTDQDDDWEGEAICAPTTEAGKGT